ncbi:MAG: oligoribonuclease [Mariprofundus sp.]|nr:oligoribonuclease [Mariprofundus sp.]
MTISKDNLVWMGLEMTGLDPEKETIIEIATIITDSELNIVDEGPCLAIHQPDTKLDAMDEWNTTHHGQSGLTARVKRSEISMRDAELQTLDFIRRYVPEGTSPLCGNSVHQDRRFMVPYMPELEAYLHYRNIDVSTIKELSRRWYPRMRPPRKQAVHMALVDIRESIEELVWYRQHLFR